MMLMTIIYSRSHFNTLTLNVFSVFKSTLPLCSLYSTYSLYSLHSSFIFKSICYLCPQHILCTQYILCIIICSQINMLSSSSLIPQYINIFCVSVYSLYHNFFSNQYVLFILSISTYSVHLYHIIFSVFIIFSVINMFCIFSVINMFCIFSYHLSSTYSL